MDWPGDSAVYLWPAMFAVFFLGGWGVGGGVNGERKLHKMLKFGDEVFGMKANLNRSGPWADRHTVMSTKFTPDLERTLSGSYQMSESFSLIADYNALLKT